jgi:hypothetical protein
LYGIIVPSLERYQWRVVFCYSNMSFTSIVRCYLQYKSIQFSFVLYNASCFTVHINAIFHPTDKQQNVVFAICPEALIHMCAWTVLGRSMFIRFLFVFWHSSFFVCFIRWLFVGDFNNMSNCIRLPNTISQDEKESYCTTLVEVFDKRVISFLGFAYILVRDIYSTV